MVIIFIRASLTVGIQTSCSFLLVSGLSLKYEHNVQMVWLAVVAFSIESDYLFSTVLWVFKSWNEEDLDFNHTIY